MSRILYADSSAESAADFLNYLKAYGLDAVHTADSSRVFELLRASPCDLLICDRWCGPLAAERICRQLRDPGNPEFRDLPVLIVGPEELRPDEFKWIYQHQMYFLIKFNSPEEWYQKILTILNHRCPYDSLS